MDLQKHKKTLEKCQALALYFRKMSFINVSSSFREAADSLEELIKVCEQLNNTPETTSLDMDA